MNALGRRVAESADDESKLLVFGQLPITGNGPFTSDSIELEFTGRYSCGRKVAGMSVRRGLEWLLAHDAVVDRPLYLFGKKGYRHGRGYSFRPSFDSSMTFSASAAVFQLADELAEFGTLLDIAFYFMNCRRDDFEKIIGDQWESIAADMPYHLREIEEWLEAVFQIKREGRK
ncbi:MAG: hypothetical protein KIS29_09780 [Thermoplasmata archaeon]|nr:hypothetical protein [Candidatus Sysuiplasma jiujiangense]